MPIKKPDPFKLLKTAPTKPTDAAVTPPILVSKQIDHFVEITTEVKRLSAEVTNYKESILEFARQEHAKRALNGKEESSFKIKGLQSLVTFINEDRGAALTDEDVQKLVDEVGEEQAKDMIQVDFASFRFDMDVLQENYEAVVKALQVLPQAVLEKLIRPGSVVAKPGAYKKAVDLAQSAEQLTKIASILKIRSYIK